MKDLDEILKGAPSITADPEQMDAAVCAAVEALQAKQNRKRIILPFVASFLGAAAAIAIGCVFFFANRPQAQVHQADSQVNRSDLLQAYSELRETFPEGFAAIAFVNGELQIYPGQVDAGPVEPTYLEMLVGNTRVTIIAAQGTTLPVMVNGEAVTIDFMPEVSGRPIVSGENFYWSVDEQYMPDGHEVLNAERLKAIL